MKNVALVTLVLAALCIFAPGKRGVSANPNIAICLKSQKHTADSQAWRLRPVIGGVAMDQRFSEVMKLLGRGRLVYRSPGYLKEKQRRYQWKTRNGTLEVGFDEHNKVVFVGLSDRKEKRSIGGIRLNHDTIASVRTKLGEPDKTEGPDWDETLVFFSLVYLVGPQESGELHFVSYIDWNKLNLDAATISPNLFLNKRVIKVFIRKRSDSAQGLPHK